MRVLKKISAIVVKLSVCLWRTSQFFLNATLNIAIAQPLMSTKRFEDEESVHDFRFVPLERIAHDEHEEEPYAQVSSQPAYSIRGPAEWRVHATKSRDGCGVFTWY